MGTNNNPTKETPIYSHEVDDGALIGWKPSFRRLGDMGRYPRETIASNSAKNNRATAAEMMVRRNQPFILIPVAGRCLITRHKSIMLFARAVSSATAMSSAHRKSTSLLPSCSPFFAEKTHNGCCVTDKNCNNRTKEENCCPPHNGAIVQFDKQTKTGNCRAQTTTIRSPVRLWISDISL